MESNKRSLAAGFTFEQINQHRFVDFYLNFGLSKTDIQSKQSKSLDPTQATFFPTNVPRPKHPRGKHRPKHSRSKTRNNYSRKSGVRDLPRRSDKSNCIGMLSPTMPCAMCQPMEKCTSHHIVPSLLTNDSHRSMKRQYLLVRCP